MAYVTAVCRLTELLERHPNELSGGEQQRAALAKVLLLQPDILLLDEPTKGLDGEFKQVLGEILQGLLRRIAREKRWTDGSVGRFLYDFFEQLIARDLHRLEKIEDRIEALEDRVLAHELDDFSAPMTALRKETMAWFRYYSQLDDVACELHENENGFFTDSEQLLFRMFEERVIRLREESQLLRESCAQLQSLFQAEIDTRQNRIMQILTIVTTIFLPLTLLVGWYGMNFVGMPELTWKYGYPVVVVVSIATVGISLWVCKKKKFW